MVPKMPFESRDRFKKSLMEYGFTEDQAELIAQSFDEFAEEQEDLTEEAKESLYKD